MPWYKNIESLLKTDEIFHQNHVKAFNSISKTKNHTKTSSSAQLNLANLALLDKLSKLRKAKPLPSKQFRTSQVLKCLKEHFKGCWEHEKSKSSKLSFYHSIKTNLHKEPYLDEIKNPVNRYRTTRLRISAHDLEIETGRYTNTPRENRTCKWCLLTVPNSNRISNTITSKVVENESHLLFNCDLYADLRTKLLGSLNNHSLTCTLINTTSSIPLPLLTINNPTLNMNHSLMKLLSPHSNRHFANDDLENQFTQYHTANDNQSIRNYNMNAIATYIAKCFEKRWTFLTELQSHTQRGPH